MSTEPRDGDVVGPYEIRGLIGRGTATAVFWAVDRERGGHVAMKVFSPSAADPSARARLDDVATRLRALGSPHVVPIEEVGEDEHRLYLVMPVFDRGDVGARLADAAAMPADLAIRLFLEVCHAVDAAHAAGLVHGALKTSNVLLWDGDGALHAAVADFDAGGLSTGIDRGAEDLATLPPERHQGGPGDQRGDIYSLGCLLHTMLAGGPPFTGTSYQVVHAHLHQQPPRLPVAVPGSRALDDVVRAAMAKDPAERPSSVGELVTLLDQATAALGLSASARPGDTGTVAPTVVHGWSPDAPTDRAGPDWDADAPTAARPHASWGPPQPSAPHPLAPRASTLRATTPSSRAAAAQPGRLTTTPTAPRAADPRALPVGSGRWSRARLAGLGVAAAALVAAAIVLPILLIGGDDELSATDRTAAAAVADGARHTRWADGDQRLCGAEAMVETHPADELQAAGLVDSSGTFHEDGWTSELAAAWFDGLVGCTDGWETKMAAGWGAGAQAGCVRDLGRGAMVGLLAADLSGTPANADEQQQFTGCLQPPPATVCLSADRSTLLVRPSYAPTSAPSGYRAEVDDGFTTLGTGSAGESTGGPTEVLLDSPWTGNPKVIQVAALYSGQPSIGRPVDGTCSGGTGSQ